TRPWRCLRRDAQLSEERARLAAPGQAQVPARACDPDVKKPALLVEVAAAHRKLALLEPRQEDRVPLESLGAVERQELDTRRDARAEAALELGAKLRNVLELVGDRDDPPEVTLPGLLALAQIGRGHGLPADREGRRAHLLCRRTTHAAQPLEQRARTLAVEQRGALKRNPCRLQELLH